MFDLWDFEEYLLLSKIKVSLKGGSECGVGFKGNIEFGIINVREEIFYVC